MRRLALSNAAFLALALSAGATAHAGTLRVSPVRLDVQPDSQFCALTLTNDRDEPVAVQVRGFGWSQDQNGEQVLDADAGPVVNPEIFTLDAGQSRLVRCAVPAATDLAAEQAWRLIVDELPGEEENAPGNVRTLLRLSLPVFRTPAGAGPDLEITPLAPTEDGQRFLLRNRGTAHVKLLDLRLPGMQPDGRSEQAFYLLAGAQREITLPVAPGTALTGLSAGTVEGVLPIRGRQESGLAAASAR